MTLTQPYVALIGGANLDIAAHAHAALLMADSNPGRILCSPGGVARNVAENLLRLGLDARLISVLGDDAFGLVLRQSAARLGLNLEACTTLPGQRTATYMSLHGVNGDMSVAVNDMDIVEQLSPALLEPHADMLRGAAALVVDSNVRPDVLVWLGSRIAHRYQYAEAVSVAKCHKLLPVMRGLYLLKANRLEAQALSGMPIPDTQSACEAALCLHRSGAVNVVISLGAEGVAWCDAAGQTGHHAVRALTMVSATGAGDALLGGLVYGHLHAMPLERSVPWAMACAELSLSSTLSNSPDLSVAAVRAHLKKGTND